MSGGNSARAESAIAKHARIALGQRVHIEDSVRRFIYPPRGHEQVSLNGIFAESAGVGLGLRCRPTSTPAHRSPCPGSVTTRRKAWIATSVLTFA